jgi:4-amino-4-deoxy-L-arabinose transferase-like glycosyltransferase
VTTPPSAAASTYRKSGWHRSAFLTSPLAWCFVGVAIEAIVILAGLGAGNAPMMGGDGPEYAQLAHNLIFHGVFSSTSSPPLLPNISRTPGYPAILAIFDYIGFRPLLIVRIAQFAMVALTAWLVYVIGREVADEWTARVAALFVGTYLPLLGLASYTLSEVTATLLTTLVVLLLIRATRRSPDSLMSAAGLGLALAALAYVRPEYELLVAIAAVALLLTGDGRFRSRQRWLRPAIVIGVFLVAVAPWTIRNASLTGQLIPLATGSGVSLLESADQYAGTISDAMTTNDWDKYLHQVSVIDSSVHGKPGPMRDVAADAAYTRAAERIMARLSLTTVLERMPRREVYLWQTAAFPPNPKRDRALFEGLGVVQYVILLVLMLIGAIASRRKLLRNWLLWVVAVYVSLLHLVFGEEGRYSVEARPALLVFAAIGAVACWRALRPRFDISRTRDETPSVS